MRQVIKTFLLAAVAIFGLKQSLCAFSPAGPLGTLSDAWQVTDIGYGPPSDALVAPKNIGEEYRFNTPVLYYACDATFLDYFGSNGVVAVQGAFNIMNNAFTNNPTGITNGLDGYSKTLSEIPLETRHVNYQAQALGIYDLKSYTLNILVRELGLVDPVQYAWTLHDRSILPNTTCPSGMIYTVVQRNFDTGGSPIANGQSVTSLYSPYVNGVLYTYFIQEVCQNSAVLAKTVPIPVDPTQVTYSAVASQTANLNWGNYYTGLTRDDIMGLRYLLTTNTINTETATAGSLLTVASTNTASQVPFPANTNSPQGYGTFSLSALISASLTNDPITLEGLYPGLIVSTSSNLLVLVTNQTVISYYTNLIGAAAGSPPVLVVTTNFSLGFATNYFDTFANIVTNHYYPTTKATLQTVTVGPLNGSAAGNGTLQTNITSKTVTFTNLPSGDFYIVTNDCGLDIVDVLLTHVIYSTNLITSTSSTNVTTTTTSTNNSAYSYTQNLITSYTNYTFRTEPVTCSQIPDATGLYEGIEKIKFIYSSYDSDVGQFYQPITNNYTMVVVTNSQPHVQHFQRIITAPDMLFQAEDLATGNAGYPVLVPIDQVSAPNFDQANALPTLAGPGTINPPLTVQFEKVGPVFFNDFDDLTGTNFWAETPTGGGSGTDILDTFYGKYFIWGSFDGTTNAPVVYPDGSTLDDLGNLIFVQISPSSVPNGTMGTNYTAVTFTISGGSFTPPYTWSASGLPAGLSVSADGTLSGTPTQSGSFVFTLTMTDENSRSVQWNYPLTILQ